MFRPRLSSKVAVVVMILAVGTSYVDAAQRRPSHSLVSSADLSAGDSLFARLWGALVGLWAEEGCSPDPDGRCTTRTTTADNGCTLDPNGRCIKVAPVDTGCTLDPDGRCTTSRTKPTVNADNGCTIDPDGRCLGAPH